MAILPISRAQAGMILKDHVYSKLGGLLYKKGTVLKEEDREIFTAFGVSNIEIIDKESLNKQRTNGDKIEKEIPGNRKNNQDEKFNHAYRLISRILISAQGTPQIPVIELRNTIEPLLEYSQQNPRYLFSQHLQKDLNKYDIHHALSVGLLSYLMSKWLGLEEGEWMQIALAGILHDVGIRRIPNRILEKTKRLDYDEKEEIKKHTIYGYQMLKGTKGLNEGVMMAVLQHHERHDGSGYPLHLKKDQIHLYSKIIAVADVFHAMVSKRSYREGIPFFNVLDQLVEESFGKLDPNIVQTFVKMMSQFTLGKSVLLNNGTEGVIFFINEQKPTRPWIKVSDQIINLEIESKLTIKDIFFS